MVTVGGTLELTPGTNTQYNIRNKHDDDDDDDDRLLLQNLCLVLRGI